jgi:beta-N-acetylhexosaminidase/D-alanyl-D-alanine dipeptidase
MARGIAARLLGGLLLGAWLAGAAWAGPLEDAGLVELVTLDPSIKLDIRYATRDNFTGQAVYPSGKCFLRRAVAQRVVAAQKILQEQGLGLKIYDCYRPFNVQKRFWEIMPVEGFVAKPVEENGRPVQGSKHNRGAAVDLTLIDAQGNELEMPTPFDDFSEKAGRAYPGNSLKASANMKKLEATLAAQGFTPLPTEWWHFDGPGWERYELLDAPLD